MEPKPTDVDHQVIRAGQRKPDLNHRARKTKPSVSQRKAHNVPPSKSSSLRTASQEPARMHVRSLSVAPLLHVHPSMVDRHDLGFEDLSLDQDPKLKDLGLVASGEAIPSPGQVNFKKRALRSNASHGATQTRRARAGAEGILGLQRPGHKDANNYLTPPLSSDYCAIEQPGIHKSSRGLLQQNRITKDLSIAEDHQSTGLCDSVPQVSRAREKPGVPQNKEPPSRKISQDELAAEVKGIYDGLAMVEQKCVNYDRALAQAIRTAQGGDLPRLENDQWQALIALHRTLLHEHHDFFLASQHPSATQALRELAERNSMAARMWKHAIHSFLEILRHHLPNSLDYMVAFIYIAYQMVALLLETVPSFKTTWIECLGDLARYRMAIEDDDRENREVWTAVARSWYSKAADYRPGIGRLYHHLAILARPYALQQLYLYCRSLTCVQPFLSARESILTLFDPILARSGANDSWSLSVDASFIKCHATLFKNLSEPDFDVNTRDFFDALDSHISSVKGKWRLQGIYIAVANIAALCGYGCPENAISRAVRRHEQERDKSIALVQADVQTKQYFKELIPLTDISHESWNALVRALRLFISTLKVTLCRTGDSNVLPNIYVILVFFANVATIPYVMEIIGASLPWAEISQFLSILARSERMREGNHFHQPDGRPLPEEYLIRGQTWCQAYWPEGYFEEAKLDEEERFLELPSTAKIRAEKILWLGTRIASLNVGLSYNAETRTFSMLNNIATHQPFVSLSAADAPNDKSAGHRDINFIISGAEQSQHYPGPPPTAATSYIN